MSSIQFPIATEPNYLAGNLIDPNTFFMHKIQIEPSPHGNFGEGLDQSLVEIIGILIGNIPHGVLGLFAEQKLKLT